MMIRSATALRNDYDGMVKLSTEKQEPIYLTRNGDGDLAVMSIEAYEALARRAQLVQELERGHADVEAGRTMSAAEAIRRLREEF